MCDLFYDVPGTLIEADPPLLVIVRFSSTSRGSLLEFSHSITEFLSCYVRALPVPRVTTFLALLLEAIRKRCIGSTGAICAILAAFDVGEAKVPAMGCHELFQLKEMLLVVLPPLNQVKQE